MIKALQILGVLVLAALWLLALGNRWDRVPGAGFEPCGAVAASGNSFWDLFLRGTP